jgi:hypothetical protein
MDKKVTAQAEGAGPAVQVAFEGLEVTQAIQEPAHSVALVAGKVTVARLYLGVQSPNGVRVRGTLTVKNGSQPAVEVPSLNEIEGVAAMNGSLPQKRADIALSLNFLLPAATIVAGTATLSIGSIVDAPTGRPVTVTGAAATSVTFVAGAPLRLRLLGVRHRNTTGEQTVAPVQRDVDLIFSWLRRAYPIARLDATYAVVNGTKRAGFEAIDVNAQLAAIRRQDITAGTDRRTHYYGVVPDGFRYMRGKASAIPQTPDPSAVASGPTGSMGFAWDTDGSYGDWYAGHELAHTFGRFHPGFCDQTHDDASFPYQDGQLADDASLPFVGLDSGDSAAAISIAALPGADWHDVMTYCDRQWVSAYTYEAIRTRLLAEEALGSGSGRQAGAGIERSTVPNERLINVVATLNLSDGTGRIAYVNPVGADARDDYEVHTDGEVTLVLRGRGGDVIDEVRVPYRLQSRAQDEPLTALVDAVITAPDGVSSMALVYGGRELDLFQRGATPSQVSGVRAREVSADGGAAIVWESAQAADPAVTYSVQVSRDEGTTWETVGVNLPEPEMTLNPADYPDATEVRVRVSATDGFEVTDVSESTVTLK